MKVRVFYHDKCFDGACSAALFSRFYRERIRNDVTFVFSGLLHRAGSLFDEKQFDGDENAIVDFKYSSSPRITWWFDHHLSAFLTPEDAAHFEQDQSNRKFYDPDFKSCTSFIATIAQQRFGFDPSPVADLVHWTDIVDGAMYPDARTAVEMQGARHEAHADHRVGAELHASFPSSSRCWPRGLWPRFWKSPSWRHCCRRCWSGTSVRSRS